MGDAEECIASIKNRGVSKGRIKKGGRGVSDGYYLKSR